MESKGQPYISISHVWDQAISDIQARGPHFPQDIDIRRRLFSSVLSIVDGLTQCRISHQQKPDTEIWHDYLSVPQWQLELKARILHAIPAIFQRAEYTLVHLSDVNSDTVHSLRHGSSTEERLAAVTQVCNAAWFKRVWTVMEFVRASRIKVMLDDHRIVDGVDDVFLGKLSEVWDQEANTHGAGEVEGMVRLGATLVPWNLGPLLSARHSQKLDFAVAWILLSRRGCRSIHDFLHALVGLLRAPVPDMKIPLFTEDPVNVVKHIALACVQSGDFSPLLMTPTDEPYSRRHEWRTVTRDGFNDVTTFGLGGESSPPTLHDATSMSSGVVLSLKMDRIGKVTFVFKSPRDSHQMASWAHVAQIILNFTGPDADSFATTACCRLYHMPPDQVNKILRDTAKRQELESILQSWYNNPGPNTFMATEEALSNARRLADLLHLNDASPINGSGVSALTFLQMHGGTIHLGWFGGFIGVTCSACSNTFLYRAAFYKPPSEIRKAVAYRVPGLSYHFASRDGVGLLVQNGGVIVGRLHWATPACECFGTEMVDVELTDFYSVVAG
ncbi:hypothetical protein QBC34DRAFT_469392 [Podospora aff. communis PSN243]|uniref:Heterokaryon incompatibility domain-containing protein n=1 Tax=Podospora aff. communis PSN243 TaxID=3040156 RepID=A0AAV9GE53_9PEZI|nr:hypothetical protein QBC34DRAFT_469392 [Podospora aff. communis PSN243]